MYIRVKICGITNQQDAHNAIQSGSDALGFVFYSLSKRYIDITSATEIINSLPPFVSTVGLFVNQSADFVNDVLAKINLNCLQFHGDETPEFCEQFGRQYIKAIKVSGTDDILRACEQHKKAAALLLDANVTGQFGGTGQAFDWRLIPAESNKPLIIAGGLTIDNLQNLLNQISPFAVDVSSGVEISAKEKDLKLMQSFCSIVATNSTNK